MFKILLCFKLYLSARVGGEAQVSIEPLPVLRPGSIWCQYVNTRQGIFIETAKEGEMKEQHMYLE